MGRVYAPDLVTGHADAVVLLLPGRMLSTPWSELMSVLVTGGAFAAFLSTSSGLSVSVAGVISQDLLRGRLRASVSGFRIGAVFAVMILVSLRTRAPAPSSTDRIMVRLHAPEGLDLDHTRNQGH
ncbi:MAG: hypothetical protein QG622_1615 [Actinomycetota bacterium]|nr:hypothetical protein [Actinomycetota bacterium]